MITETLSCKKHPALTSDLWHVVHARWSGNESGEPRFERKIVSEHADRDSAADAGRKIVASIANDMAARPRECRDQILVRRPAYKSLKASGRFERRHK